MAQHGFALKEKHDGWREIMSEMPDKEIAGRMNVDYAPSLFALLKLFIETDNALIEEFYKKTITRFIIGIIVKAILLSETISGEYIPISGICKERS